MEILPELKWAKIITYGIITLKFDCHWNHLTNICTSAHGFMKISVKISTVNHQVDNKVT